MTEYKAPSCGRFPQWAWKYHDEMCAHCRYAAILKSSVKYETELARKRADSGTTESTKYIGLSRFSRRGAEELQVKRKEEVVRVPGYRLTGTDMLAPKPKCLESLPGQPRDKMLARKPEDKRLWVPVGPDMGAKFFAVVDKEWLGDGPASIVNEPLEPAGQETYDDFDNLWRVLAWLE